MRSLPKGWWIVMLAGMVLVASACSRKTPQEVMDLNRALGEAKDDCASAYAASSLAAVQGDVDAVNRLVNDNKHGKARKSAEEAMSAVNGLKSEAARARDGAREAARKAIGDAESSLDTARSEFQAETYASSEFKAARDELERARRMMSDPCMYLEAKAGAEEASSKARKAGAAAVAEKKRREEEEARRLAEEEARRRAEEEARRLAELRARPGTYEVVRGDYLWKISGMERIYRASMFWPLIFDANRGQIQDPDLIYPGQSLTIPREISEAEMMEKLRIMWSKAARGDEL